MHRYEGRIRNHTADSLPRGPDIDQVNIVSRGHSQLLAPIIIIFILF